ncbi:alpha/beta hydrolase family protein [Pseudooceanicola sp. MF1-13]|uniref:alpha/beta hydrolase family protein n=1 Tax=Pseudooceanicola sp. MF1-13 TaxID=3379095 RepID=UPI0038919ED7
MRHSTGRGLFAVALCLDLGLAASAVMAENRIDGQRPFAPELAAYGDMKVGVRTLDLVNPDQIDVVAVDPSSEKPETLPTYDRELTIEVWYPAADNAEGDTTIQTYLRDGQTEIEIAGSAHRDAEPAAGTYPLVLVSHGWPGNRYLMSHLGENLASKGYVVASIDHNESTYRTFQVSDNYFATFGSTLVNRPLDQLFVLDQIAQMSGDDSSFLNGLVDASTTGLIGYSMGGYGALVTAGGGVSEAGVNLPFGASHGLLDIHSAGSDTHDALPDDRIKTIVTLGPWGRNWNMWDAEGLSGVSVPALMIAGSMDEVSGYENGVRQIWKETTGVDRALLTFNSAGHNAGAPMPVPSEALEPGVSGSDHYLDAVWDTTRMNNISQHFITAWLDWHLKDDTDKEAFLDLVPVANEGVWAANDDGTFKPEHTYWKGFDKGWGRGLRMEWLKAGE